MTTPTKPSRKAENVFLFRVLFQRSFLDDAEAVGGMEKLTGGDGEMSRSLIDQLASEINLNPAFRNRFVFSPYIIFAGNEYYILGQITINSPMKNSLEAWDTFLKEFQSTYDEYGMAGHFRIEPTDNQSDMRDWAKEDAWPVPPWSETPYVPPKLLGRDYFGANRPGRGQDRLLGMAGLHRGLRRQAARSHRGPAANHQRQVHRRSRLLRSRRQANSPLRRPDRTASPSLTPTKDMAERSAVPFTPFYWSVPCDLMPALPR